MSCVVIILFMLIELYAAFVYILHAVISVSVFNSYTFTAIYNHSGLALKSQKLPSAGGITLRLSLLIKPVCDQS